MTMKRVALTFSLLMVFSIAHAEPEEGKPVYVMPAAVKDFVIEKKEILNPWAVTAAITVPQPLTIGIERKFDVENQLSAFLEGGWFKYSFGEGKSRSVKDYSIISGVRYRPFLNWLTLTGELGFRHIGVQVDISNLKMDGQSLANTATLGVNALFLGILVGGQWLISENVAVGFDVGLQMSVPLAHGGKVDIRQNPSQVDGSDLSVDDEEVMKRISSIPIPQIALARFVWYI
jgi:hypothetical protein